MTRRDRTDLSPVEGVLSTLLAVVLAIIATLLLVHWAQCSQEGPALCTLTLAALPVRGPWWRRIARRLQCWHVQRRLRAAQTQVLQYQRLLLEDSIEVDHWQGEVSDLQDLLLDLRSQP